MGGYWSSQSFPTPEQVAKSYEKRIITVDDLRRGFQDEFRKEVHFNRHPDQVHVSIYGIITGARDAVLRRGVRDWALLVDERGNCLDGEDNRNRKEFVYNTVLRECADAIPGWTIDKEHNDIIVLRPAKA